MDLECSLPAIHYALEKMGLTYKKDASGQRAKPPRHRAVRRRWRRRQLGFDPVRLIFLDESGAKTNLTRLRGRAPRGQRVHASSPQGHWHTTTMICAMRLDGSTACMTIEGATDTEVFRPIPRVLSPTLRKGDVVIMDNLSPHKSEPTLSLMRRQGPRFSFCRPTPRTSIPLSKCGAKSRAPCAAPNASQPALIQAMLRLCERHTRTPSIFAHCGYSFI